MPELLTIQEYLKVFGLENAIEKFKLKCKMYPKKIHLKYDQLESNMSLTEVQECRGLILEKDTWKVMSMSFKKFFNHGESNAAKIDWDTAHVLEKVDGTMIQVYWDYHNQEWFAATTGTAEGEGEVNNKMGTTFNELFWKTIFDKSPKFKLSYLDKNVTYVFELTTPYNIVVKPHGESSVTLLAARYNDTLVEATYTQLKETAYALHVNVVKAFDLNAKDFDSLIKTFEGMPWSEEGYVVIDGNFNRVKIKNPAYVAVHHLKDSTALYNILTIIKTNEVDEFISTFPERKEEVLKLRSNYDLLIHNLNNVWAELYPLQPKDLSSEEKKRYALLVFEITKKHNLERFTDLFFRLQKGSVKNISDYIKDYDNKKLYDLL